MTSTTDTRPFKTEYPDEFLKEHLGPMRYGWKLWTPAAGRFMVMPANHFIATHERQCEELREIEATNPADRMAYAKEFADQISVGLNGLRWCTGNRPDQVDSVLQARASRYFDPNAIMDKYIREHGA